VVRPSALVNHRVFWYAQWCGMPVFKLDSSPPRLMPGCFVLRYCRRRSMPIGRAAAVVHPGSSSAKSKRFKHQYQSCHHPKVTFGAIASSTRRTRDRWMIAAPRQPNDILRNVDAQVFGRTSPPVHIAQRAA
jgi:hypothetical protein